MSAAPSGSGITAHLAIVDDEERLAEVLAMVLRREGHRVTTFNGPPSLLEALPEHGFDLVLTDLKMPGMDGVALLERLGTLQPELPVVLMTAYASVESAVAAMKLGAVDYLIKPIDNEHCRRVVARTLEMTRLTRENRYLRAQLSERFGPGGMIAESEPMRRVLDLVERAARSRATVLISGESGTGKEVTARAIHYCSDRVGKPFVAVNCKAFAPTLLESELFGHEKGAFTGASGARAGVFERAQGGTLFLDEIGEVSEDFQAKLLRAVQEREVQPVGGTAPRPVDVRLLSATNRNLEAEVAAGRFREDLYYRLAVIPIRLPPLRERRADVKVLARAFLGQFNAEQSRCLSGWSEEVDAYFDRHPWPGNVRELQNTIERGVVLARGAYIELSDIVLGDANDARVAGDASDEAPLTLQQHLDHAAAERVRTALRDADGVRIEAARALGVERTTLYRLMKRFGIAAAAHRG